MHEATKEAYRWHMIGCTVPLGPLYLNYTWCCHVCVMVMLMWAVWCVVCKYYYVWWWAVCVGLYGTYVCVVMGFWIYLKFCPCSYVLIPLYNDDNLQTLKRKAGRSMTFCFHMYNFYLENCPGSIRNYKTKKGSHKVDIVVCSSYCIMSFPPLIVVVTMYMGAHKNFTWEA